MAAKGTHLIVRLTGVILLAAVGSLLVGRPLAMKRQEGRIRTTLLAVQEALQRYHVSEEIYPKKMMTGHELVRFLAESEFIKRELPNPWTGDPYFSESSHDWLRYRTNSTAETYELVVTYPDSEEVQFRLDSTDHQSLE